MSDNPEQKRILNLYGLFGASIVVSVLPYAQAAILSIIFFTVLLVMGYVFKNKAEPESLQHNHALYIVRTLWITAFFSLITTTLGSIYMMSGIDYTPFQPCADDLAGLGLEAVEGMGVMEIYAYVEPCVGFFIEGNWTLLMNTMIITAMPLFIYIGYRFAKGLGRAMKGYRLANPQSWF